MKGDFADILVGCVISFFAFAAGAPPMLLAIYPVRRSDEFALGDLVLPAICFLFLLGGIHFMLRGIFTLIRGD